MQHVKYSDEDVAQVIHAANTVVQTLAGDIQPSMPWHSETDELRESVIEGVRRARNGETPEQLHQSWVTFKAAHGWVYGPVKDAGARTHPCMRPYWDLPAEQRVKDRVFHAIVAALTLDY